MPSQKHPDFSLIDAKSLRIAQRGRESIYEHLLAAILGQIQAREARVRGRQPRRVFNLSRGVEEQVRNKP